MKGNLLRRMSPLLALSCRAELAPSCPLLGEWLPRQRYGRCGSF